MNHDTCHSFLFTTFRVEAPARLIAHSHRQGLGDIGLQFVRSSSVQLRTLVFLVPSHIAIYREDQQTNQASISTIRTQSSQLAYIALTHTPKILT